MNRRQELEEGEGLAGMVRDAAARLLADHVDNALREAAEADPDAVALAALATECERTGLLDALGAAPSLQALPLAAAVASEAGRHAVPLPLVEWMVERWAASGWPDDERTRAPARETIAVAARPAARPFARAPEPVRHVHLALRCVQAAGAMEAALAMALRYANDRVQFGRPLARFQAIQHQLAVAAEEVAAARVAADHAVAELAALGSPPADLEARAWRALAAAKIRCSEAIGVVVDTTHQVHGAIGFTREYGLHHFTRRLMAWRDEHGSEATWAEALGRRIAAHGDLWELVTGDD